MIHFPLNPIIKLADKLVPTAVSIAVDLGTQAAKAYASYYIASWALSKITFDPSNLFKINDPDKARETARLVGEVIGVFVNEVNKEASASALRNWVPTIIAMGLASTALPLAYQYIQKVLLFNIGKPPLALKERKITYFNMLKEKLNEFNPYAAPPEELTKPIFKKEVENQIQNIVDATNNIQRNKSFFQNVILYGPGGTGKTMIAEKIAKEAGMNYLMMSGGELGMYIKRGEHVSELNKLLDSAENSSVPTIIFIDESEGLCKNRADLDQERLELQNTLLNRTGTPSKQIMIILATNRITDIDKAILNRMTYKVHIDVPGLEERVQIIDLYAKKFFEDAEERIEFFGSDTIAAIAQKTDKLSGRSLFYIINAIFAKKCGTVDNRLTKNIIDQTVNDYVAQESTLNALSAAPAA